MSGAAPAPADKGSGVADGSAAPEQAEEALALVRGMGFGEAAAAAALQASGGDAQAAIELLLGSGGGGDDKAAESAAVEKLVALGFEAGACERALAACGGDVEAAAEALLGGGGGGGDMAGSPGPGALDALIARFEAAKRRNQTGDATGALEEYGGCLATARSL